MVRAAVAVISKVSRWPCFFHCFSVHLYTAFSYTCTHCHVS
jgi:hypothetical protein